MRNSPLFVFCLLTGIFFSSCKKNGDDTGPDQPSSASDNVLMEYEGNYILSDGTLVPLIKTRVVEEASKRSLYLLLDTTKDSYTRYFFNNAGLLEKVLFHNQGSNFSSNDSILINRSGNGVFEIIKTTEVPTVCTVTPTPDGGRQVVRKKPTLPSAGSKTSTFNKDGLLVSEIFTASGANYSSYHYSYDAAGKLVEKRDTMIATTGMITTRKHTIVKNNSPNTFQMSFLRKLAGADLEWILFDRDVLLIYPFRFGDYLSEYMFLQNGTVTSHTFTSTIATDGQNFEPASSPEMNIYQTKTDAKGRITRHELKNSSWTQIWDFKYFD